MPKFIALTPKRDNLYKRVFVNCNAIESVFDMEDGAHITFCGEDDASLDVLESAETVIDLIRFVHEPKVLK